MAWRWYRRRTPTKHYLAHKEVARVFVHERLLHFNQYYGLTWKRIAIRNQKTCWGSCSEKGNLNFNYKLLFLPAHLADYIIIHELCHLRELNHSKAFWALVARACPEYEKYRKELSGLTVRRGKVVYLRK